MCSSDVNKYQLENLRMIKEICVMCVSFKSDECIEWIAIRYFGSSGIGESCRVNDGGLMVCESMFELF